MCNIMKYNVWKGGIMLEKPNIDLLVEKGSISYKRLAIQAGVTERTMFNWFGKPMDQVKRLRVLKAIDEIRKDVKS